MYVSKIHRQEFELKEKLLETVMNSYKEPNGNGERIDYVRWLEDYRGEDNTEVAATFYKSMKEAIGEACDDRDILPQRICECFNLTSLRKSQVRQNFALQALAFATMCSVLRLLYLRGNGGTSK